MRYVHIIFKLKHVINTGFHLLYEYLSQTSSCEKISNLYKREEQKTVPNATPLQIFANIPFCRISISEGLSSPFVEKLQRQYQVNITNPFVCIGFLGFLL